MKPISFTKAMAEAIIADHKTQTRRLVTQPEDGEDVVYDNNRNRWTHGHSWCDPNHWEAFDEPYKPGDVLYVREDYWQFGHWEESGWHAKGFPRWKFVPASNVPHAFEKPCCDEARISMDKTNPERDQWYKRNGRFMPRAFARTKLEVVSVRLERLQSISEADAMAEGCRAADYATGRECILSPQLGSYRLAFKALWDSIHGKDTAKCWAANPWVRRVEFRSKA